MFGFLESERKRRENRENESQKQGPAMEKPLMKVRLQNVQKMAYIALQTSENTNLT